MDRRLVPSILAMAVALGLVGWHLRITQAATDQPGHFRGRAIRVQEEHPASQNEEARQLQQQVEAGKAKAAENGYYACCITPACSWCLLNLGRCTCALGVGSGRYACRECHGGWEAGQGRIPGKTKEDVRKMQTIAPGGESAGVEDTERESARRTNVLSAPRGQGKAAVMNTRAVQAETKRKRQARRAGRSATRTVQAVQVGAKLFQGRCLSCHKMGGTGGTSGPDLTHEARRHASIAWQIEHLKNPSKVHPGSSMPSFASLPPQQLRALAAYLVTRH
ncbi:MAG TPA: c-type cytochrome [Chthonomonadaceae bacterium]|nr:c-type cytochrome [Chthonomonadaceae bacterium]